MIGRIAACVALMLLVTAPLRVEAHHSAVMFDDQNLYFGVKCYDRNADQIIATELRRDSSFIFQNDSVAIVATIVSRLMHMITSRNGCSTVMVYGRCGGLTCT